MHTSLAKQYTFMGCSEQAQPAKNIRMEININKSSRRGITMSLVVCESGFVIARPISCTKI